MVPLDLTIIFCLFCAIVGFAVGVHCGMWFCRDLKDQEGRR